MKTVGKAISADSASSLLDSADAIALRDQVGGKPEQQAEIDQAEADRGEAEREQLAEKCAAGERDRRAVARARPARRRRVCRAFEPKRSITACASSRRPRASRNLADSGMNAPSRTSDRPVGRLSSHRIRQPKNGCSSAEKPLAAK